MGMIGLKAANYLGRVESLRQTNGLIASLTSYPDAGYAENLHYHDTLHLSLVLQGGNLEKRRQKNIERVSGVVTFYDPGEPHQSTHTMAGSRHVNLEITGQFLEHYQARANAEDLARISSPDAGFLMLQVYKEMQLADADGALEIESSVLRLLGLATLPRRWSQKPAWVKKVDAVLHDRWDEKVTLDELAGVAQLHPGHLSAYFPQYFGCTIGEYRRKLKIDRALTYMGRDSRSLTEVAYLCGFADQSHFIRVFKTQTGWSPRRLKQMLS
jgi:AraC family transcriptional regulator